MALTQIKASVVADDAIVAAKIADDAVVQAAIADASVDEARLQISNAGNNGEYLQKQSGNTGGLTWAAVVGAYNGWQEKSTAYTLLASDQIAANSSTAFTLTLPASPSSMDTVIIRNFGTGTVTLNRNGQNIESTADDGELAAGSATQLVFITTASRGWSEV